MDFEKEKENIKYIIDFNSMVLMVIYKDGSAKKIESKDIAEYITKVGNDKILKIDKEKINTISNSQIKNIDYLIVLDRNKDNEPTSIMAILSSGAVKIIHDNGKENIWQLIECCARNEKYHYNGLNVRECYNESIKSPTGRIKIREELPILDLSAKIDETSPREKEEEGKKEEVNPDGAIAPITKGTNPDGTINPIIEGDKPEKKENEKTKKVVKGLVIGALVVIGIGTVWVICKDASKNNKYAAKAPKYTANNTLEINNDNTSFYVDCIYNDALYNNMYFYELDLSEKKLIVNQAIECLEKDTTEKRYYCAGHYFTTSEVIGDLVNYRKELNSSKTF